MIVENAPEYRLLGNIGHGVIFRHKEFSYLSVNDEASTKEDKILAVNIVTGKLSEFEPVVSVDVFPNAKIVF